MQERNELNPADRELETAFASLRPAAARIDPVAASFSAGVSPRRQLRVWQSAAAIFLLVGVGGWFANGRFDDRIPGRPSSAESNHSFAVHSPASDAQLSVQSLMQLRRAVREKGIDALPEVHLPAVQSVRADEMF